MATMTVSLPDPMKEWIEAQITQSDYASTSDYVRDLVRRDRARREQELTLDKLTRLQIALPDSVRAMTVGIFGRRAVCR